VCGGRRRTYFDEIGDVSNLLRACHIIPTIHPICNAPTRGAKCHEHFEEMVARQTLARRSTRRCRSHCIGAKGGSRIDTTSDSTIAGTHDGSSRRLGWTLQKVKQNFKFDNKVERAGSWL